jgi:peroxiredoxin (alkyl hydroperoxide reductase subunit C)
MGTLFAQQAPDFSATAVMPDDGLATISLSDYRSEYGVLFLRPLDFCSSPSNRPAPVSDL